MVERIVRFSRLLRIFKLNDSPAFIIELEENNQKTLYISYYKPDKTIQSFESYNKTLLKEEFENLSTHCLMSQCTDASYMFNDSPLTHFEADCSSLVCADSMFESSSLCFLNTQFPLLKNSTFMFARTKVKKIAIDFPKLKDGQSMFEDSCLEKITSKFPLLEIGDYMFCQIKIKEIDINFLKLKSGVGMFYKSHLEKITSQFPMLKNGDWMFEDTKLEEINCQFPKIKDKDKMFNGTPNELRQNYPYYFV